MAIVTLEYDILSTCVLLLAPQCHFYGGPLARHRYTRTYAAVSDTVVDGKIHRLSRERRADGTRNAAISLLRPTISTVSSRFWKFSVTEMADKLSPKL